YQKRCVLLGHSRPITALRFSPNGKLIASGGMDNRVKLWTTASGSCIQTIHSTISGPITDISWETKEEGRLSLVFSCADGTIYVYEQKDGQFEAILCLQAHGMAIESIDYDPINRRLASCAGGEVKIWTVLSNGAFTTFEQ
ncbi:hypothetical protein M422DRAFT_181673, partial [Sphaerobolus stellatus SS14]